ncbi:serine protease inhibitor Kazal-type 10 [Spodoptera frugiperda]|uniref:Serine protease inhibitor Kazal-type 10 n=1 Tax=Spodoptera frugiperda TaxID=7108 RepID=A0A9R0DIC3_SPOFR|nr:serine protease inhibitor Kazal-type 10 [Spodoptera frugiperda]
MLKIVTIIFLVTHYAHPKTFKFLKDYKLNESHINKSIQCDHCIRLYFPVCADDNLTYTNECRFKCIMAKRKFDDRATIMRYGPCILGSRRKRALNIGLLPDIYA